VEDFMAGLARLVIRQLCGDRRWLIAAALCVVLPPSLADSVNTDNSSSCLPVRRPSTRWRWRRRSSPRARRKRCGGRAADQQR
jgi:hypothetical protein